MSKRMQYCYACGKELGVYYLGSGEFDTRGNTECSKILREDMRASRDERQCEAERDDYQRY
jgi:hypothetical protein